MRSREIIKKTTNEEIRRMKTKRTARMKIKNASDVIATLTQRTNARRSIQSASNVTKPLLKADVSNQKEK
jgi:hypothetical protein